ncbi:hypothetical protein HUW63_31220 [Myxococcus sp. AM001]|nr:hypothetical protein [Myxococcus sp. AM001]
MSDMKKDGDSEAERILRCAELPGREWRLLAHDGGAEIEMRDRGIFDELTVDHWLHVEQLDVREWWLRVGDARLLVSVESGGAVRVDVERGFYSQALGETKFE